MRHDPAAYERDGLDRDRDAAAIATASGAVLRIVPARLHPASVLAGEGDTYLDAAVALRDQWARAELVGDGRPDPALLAPCVRLAIAHAYPSAPADAIDEWIGADDGAAVLGIARAAIGCDTPRHKIRRRAIALAACGLADARLTAQEAAGMDDLARTSGRAI